MSGLITCIHLASCSPGDCRRTRCWISAAAWMVVAHTISAPSPAHRGTGRTSTRAPWRSLLSGNARSASVIAPSTAVYIADEGDKVVLPSVEMRQNAALHADAGRLPDLQRPMWYSRRPFRFMWRPLRLLWRCLRDLTPSSGSFPGARRLACRETKDV